MSPHQRLLHFKMLSLEQCRKTDSALEELSDEELLKIRDLLQEAAQLAFEDYQEKKSMKIDQITKNRPKKFYWGS